MIPQIRHNPVTLTAELAEWAQQSLALAFFEPEQHPRDIARGLSSLVGYVGFGGLSPFIVAATTAVAAGAMLTMIVDTMIPGAFAETHDWAGLIAVVGFLVSFTLTKLTG